MPTIPKKPSDAATSTQNLHQALEKVSKAVEQATDSKGDVSLDDVARELQGDAAARAAFDAIRNDSQFVRTKTRRTSDGCGGSRTYTEEVAPTKLKSAEVRSVLSALLEAKANVDKKDKDGDGKISREELNARGGRGLDDRISDAAIGTVLRGFEREMSQWLSALSRVKTSVDARAEYESMIVDVSKHHAKSKAGREALGWAFRQIFAEGHTLRRGEMDRQLNGAEGSWRSRFMFFGDPGKGHLDDVEIKRFLGTDDLHAFVAERKAEIADLIGGSWEAHWLTGKDIAGSDQLNDPDFKAATERASAGCGGSSSSSSRTTSTRTTSGRSGC